MAVKEIKRAAVLGAGVMGATIAAHLANVGLSVYLLDIVPRGALPIAVRTLETITASFISFPP